MADPFEPRFVDLVRNTTTTTGTGSFNLGPAVSGFTSFANALSVGDRFYYCAINNDKSAEREVGRGTLLAGGAIAREPVDGPLVNFTSGAKTVALVAAAEWYNNLQQAGASGAGARVAQARSNLAALPASTGAACLLLEPGREGLFIFEGGDLSAKVASDTQQGLFVAPSTAPTGTSGAWVRKVDGAVNPHWFGISSTNSGAANSAGWSAMQATLAACAPAGSFYRSIGHVKFPDDCEYLFASTIDTDKGSLIIEGCSTPTLTSGTTIKVVGATAIRIQRGTTEGASGDRAVAGEGGDYTVVRNLRLKGGYVSGAEAEYHGIHLRARAILENVLIDGFHGDGIHSSVSGDGSGGYPRGNTNGTAITNCKATNCRNGVYIDGPDANVWSVTGFDASLNRQWGIWDSSFLGCYFFGCHTADNGVVPANTGTSCPATIVHHAGHRYYVKLGQAVPASTNAPSGTTADNAWWAYLNSLPAAPGVPIWANGINVREGGSYKSEEDGAATLWAGCYAEDGQAIPYFGAATLAVGGMLPIAPNGSGARLRNSAGELQTNYLAVMNRLYVNGDTVRIGPQPGAANDLFLHWDSPNVGATHIWRTNGTVTGYDFCNSVVGRGIDGIGGITLKVAGTERLGLNAAGAVVTGTIAASGAITGANLSGNNTGDQTITLTGDVTGSGSGSFPATIGNDKVTYAKLQDVSAASRLIGRGSASAGDPQELTVGAGLTIVGTALTLDSAWQEKTLTSDYTGTTSFADISDGTNALSYTPPANSNFEIQAALLLQTAAATNLPRIGVHVNAQGSGAFGAIQIDQTGATATSRVTADGTFTTTAVDVQMAAGGFATANSPYMAFITIRGRSGGSPAAISIQMASETTPANQCLVLRGSQIRTKAS